MNTTKTKTITKDQANRSAYKYRQGKQWVVMVWTEGFFGHCALPACDYAKACRIVREHRAAALAGEIPAPR